jgi:hypothetical protein
MPGLLSEKLAIFPYLQGAGTDGQEEKKREKRNQV